MHYIHRAIAEKFQSAFGSGKILILYGPRQVGKTTFVRSFLDDRPKSRYFQCEQAQVRTILSSCDLPSTLRYRLLSQVHPLLIYKVESSSHLQDATGILCCFLFFMENFEMIMGLISSNDTHSKSGSSTDHILNP